MRNFRIALVALVVAALTTVTAASALTPKTISFTGKYAGQASTKVDGTVASISATGTGIGTLIGAGKLSGTGTGASDQQPCVPFGGTGKLTGASGSITFTVPNASKGCGDEGGHIFSLKGTATVLKATGKLLKAKGSLRFTGVYDRDGGTFTVKFTGLLHK
jgi:hypothetical protein